MATRTSTQTGNWSSISTWGGSAAPGAGDIAVISNGHVVTVDTNTTVGSTSAIGHAVTINGASNVSFGTLAVATGVTLTLRGADVTSNTLMLINRYGTFAPAAGSTILGDVLTTYASIILNKGIISAVGSNGSLINFSVPSGNYAWNNSQSAEAPTIKAWDVSDGSGTTGTYIAVLSRSWIANSANTALGSNGNSSLVFSSKSPAGILVNEKASYALVATTGDYYVNYDLGVIWFFCPVNSAPATFLAAYKYATFTKGWGISSTQGTTYNQMIFDYCAFSYMGTSSTDDFAIVATGHMTTGAGGTSQTLQLTNSTVNFCKQFLGLATCSGSSTSDYININNNTFNECQGDDLYAYCVGFDRANSTYIKFANNALNIKKTFIVSNCYGAHVWSNILVTANTGIASPLVGGVPFAGTWDDSSIDNNIITGMGLAAPNPNVLLDIGGSSGHPLNIHDNVIMYPGRAINFVSYTNIYNNLFLRAYHHGIIPTATDDCLIQAIHVYNNLFYGVGTNLDFSGYGSSPMVEGGYNHRLHIDDLQVINNTCAGSHNGYFGFGDCQDTSNVVNVMTNLQVTNNLAQAPMSGGYSARRQTAGSTVISSVHCLLWDYNLDYNFGTRYENLLHQGTFTLAGVNYNTATRNITGVALWDSSLATITTKTLVYTYTSQTSITLAWDSGTAVALVFGNRTFSADATTTNNSGVAITTNLTDSGTTWTTSYGDAACPIGNWVKITSGTGSGQYGVITNCTAHTLAVAGAFTTLPLSGDSYVILKSMVTLTATGGVNTIKAGIYWPSAPASTQTDTAISFADHSVTGSDPLLVSATNAGLTTAAALSYKFTTSSPAKDVGLATNAPATDYFGTARPQGSAYDVGFYEFVSTAVPFPWVTDFGLGRRFTPTVMIPY